MVVWWIDSEKKRAPKKSSLYRGCLPGVTRSFREEATTKQLFCRWSFGPARAKCTDVLAIP